MPSTGLHQISGDCSKRRALGSLLLILVFDALHCADGRPCCCRLRCILLRAASPLDQPFLARLTLDAMVSGYAHNLRYDWQPPKFGSDLIEGQPKSRAPRYSCRFDVAHMALDDRARWQVNSIASFQWFQCYYFKLCFLRSALGAQIIFQCHQKPRPRRHAISLQRQPVPLSIRCLNLWSARLRDAILRDDWSLSRLLRL